MAARGDFGMHMLLGRPLYLDEHQGRLKATNEVGRESLVAYLFPKESSAKRAEKGMN